MENEPPFVHGEQGERSAQVIQIDSGKHVAAVAICAALSVAAAAFAFFAYQTSLRAEKESRLTQYYLMDPHSRTPEELAAWAKFNQQHEVK